MSSAHPILPLPAQSCDCHVHVFDPDRFPFVPMRAYTPGVAQVADLRKLHQSLGIERVVLVQPSVYGTDNACLLDALDRLGRDKARGVAVVDPGDVSDVALQRLHDGGVRGLRLNLHVDGDALAQAERQVMAAGRLARALGWHLQVHADMATIVALCHVFETLGLPVVLDHFAGGIAPGLAGDGVFASLRDALRALPLYVKLSAAYRLPPGCRPDVLAQRFYEAAPDRLLWGSDWPHTGGAGGQGRRPEAIEPFRPIDNAAALQCLHQALGSEDAFKRMLVDNPARLYGF